MRLAKRLLAGTVLTAVTLQLALLSAPANAALDTQNHWANSHIDQLMQHNIIGGYPDGTFRPQNTITRAEFAAILSKALQLDTASTVDTGFSDVPISHWAAPAITSAKNAQLVSGFPTGDFRPNEPVNRAAVMAVLAKAIPGQPDANQTQSTLNQFTDANSIPNWAKTAAAETILQQVFANEPSAANRVDANLPATRAEVAAMMDKYLMRKSVAFAAPGATPNTTDTTYTANSTITPQSNTANTTLHGHVATIPENTTFSATLKTAVNSEMAQQGDTVSLTLDMPIATADNTIAIPSGTTIVGEIAEVKSAKRFENNAMVQLKFKEFVLASGERIPMKASIATDAKDNTIHGGSVAGSTGKVATKTAVGAGLGAALGTAMGPLSGGKVGKGAIYGTAIGAGLGALTGVASKGNAVELPAGQSLVLTLDESVQVGGTQQPGQ